MAATVPLQTRRDELKQQLTDNIYTTLPDLIVLKIGHLLQKITHTAKPLPFWYSSLVIFLVISLSGLGISSLLREFHPNSVMTMLGGIGLIYVGLIIFKIHHSNFNAHFREHIVDAIESERDLLDLQHWLRLTSNIKAAMSFSFVLAISAGLFLWFAYRMVTGELIGFGPIIAFLPSFIFYGAMIHYGILFSILPNRLRRYQFKLYEPDPSSSALVQHLSAAFRNALYLFAFYAALTTLVTAAEGLFVSINLFRLLGWWAFLTAFFIDVQYALAQIITTSKIRALSEVERRVEQLLSRVDLNDREAREGINWLIEYHDRINSTPNSALHLRAILEFINSLILPLLAFLLPNLNEIMNLFH
jgi:hypothetical protein